MKLKGKIAIVTGANRGIGRGCAIELAKEGANVTVNYHTHEDEAREVAGIIEEMGHEAMTFQADVAQRESVQEMVAKTIERFGRIDILVNNAAASIRKPFVELTPEDMQFTLGVSLWGFFHCGQFVVREMIKQGNGGKIIVISSVHSFIPFQNNVPYNACKAGINQMAYTLAAELCKHRINVNVIEPGWIDTPGERKWYTEEQIREEGKKLPWSRIGTIEDIGKAAAFLASDDADYITGACIRVDGGFWLPRDA